MKIVTDSVADLPSQAVGELGITIVPLDVCFSAEVYRDDIDLTAEKFYNKLMHCKILSVISVPPPGRFVEAHDRLAQETDKILAIIISRLSSSYNVAVQSIG